VRLAIEEAPALIVAGVQFTDLNSGFFTQNLPRTRTIELGASVASVGAASFGPISMRAALERLTELVRDTSWRGIGQAQGSPAAAPVSPATAGEPLDQDRLWQTVAAHLRPGDIVLADQGTSFYGMGSHRLPEGVTFLGQPLWASIGYTLPALLGACLAERGRRGVLLIGDGAAQMTVSELSSILRERLHAVVVVVDNDGFTVERAIHGAEQPYNDIARWDWTAVAGALGPDAASTSRRVTTVDELERALAGSDSSVTGLTLIQAVVPRMDVPELLSTLARAAGLANARVS
jgi:TPP-dependent 2-oxoacid decarboxylase